MDSRKDLELIEPLIQLKKALEELDKLSANDPQRRRRIDAALCHLQLGIDLLDQAQMTNP